jgi:hypothetical protein
VLTAVLTVGAAALFWLERAGIRHWVAVCSLVFDHALVSGYTVYLAYDIGTPVRQTLLLPVIEGALRFNVIGGLLVAVAALPALVGFEWRQAVELNLHDFNAGHIVIPFGLLVLTALVVGALSRQTQPRTP